MNLTALALAVGAGGSIVIAVATGTWLLLVLLLVYPAPHVSLRLSMLGIAVAVVLALVAIIADPQGGHRNEACQSPDAENPVTALLQRFERNKPRDPETCAEVLEQDADRLLGLVGACVGFAQFVFALPAWVSYRRERTASAPVDRGFPG